MTHARIRKSRSICLLVAAAVAGCGEPLRSPVTEFEPTFTHDHPPILVGSVETATFDVPVRNGSGRPVRFGPSWCSCACSDPLIPKKELADGEEMTVRLVVHTTGRVGPQKFSCSWPDDTGRPWTATASVVLHRSEQFDPDRLTIGTDDPNKPSTATAVYRQTAARAEDLPPAPAFRSDDPAVTVAAGGPSVRTVRDGIVCRETPLTLTFTPPTTTGPSSARIETRADGPGLAVSWHVRPVVTTSPPVVAFTGGNTKPVRVVLRATDGRAFRVTGVRSVDTAVTGKAAGPAAEAIVHVIEVSLEAGAEKTNRYGHLTVETTHPRAAEVRLTFGVAASGTD